MSNPRLLPESSNSYRRNPVDVGEHDDHPPPSYRASVQEASSLDLAQRLETKLATYNRSQNLFKRWLFEIASLVTSALCMAAIVGILLSSKDQPLSQRSQALNIVNVLSKIASATLILPISEAIGQLKWAWFHGSKSKEMIDFEIFDKASRGAWGSFLLLFRTKGRSLAALGAVLTLLLLATDTFLQQVTDLPERWILDGHGEIPRVVRYEGDNGIVLGEGVPLLLDEINLREITFKYFYYNGTQPVMFGNGTRPEISLSCPSSRCEWDAYQSLGLCSACTDVSQLLTYACLTTRLDWLSELIGAPDTYPNGTACGYWLNATSTTPFLASGYRINSTSDPTPGEALLLRTLPLITPPTRNTLFGGSINFDHVYYPLLDALIISAADGSIESVYRKERPVAQECMLAWCVKTIESSYHEGNYEEVVTETFLNATDEHYPHPWVSTEVISRGEKAWDVFFETNISMYPPSADRSTDGYGVSNETFARAAVLFDDMFPSSITVANDTAQPFWKVKVWVEEQNNLRVYTHCPWLAPNNVTQYIDRLATAMTNIVRSHWSNELVVGRAYTRITFIAVHWEWLAFPLVLLLLSLIFLFATIVKTSKRTDEDMNIWKTSAMPALIYSLPKDVRKDFTPSHNWDSSYKSKAKKVKIRLLPNQGWRVSGQVCTSPTLVRRVDNRAPPGWI